MVRGVGGLLEDLTYLQHSKMTGTPTPTRQDSASRSDASSKLVRLQALLSIDYAKAYCHNVYITATVKRNGPFHLAALCGCAIWLSHVWWADQDEIHAWKSLPPDLVHGAALES